MNPELKNDESVRSKKYYNSSPETRARLCAKSRAWAEKNPERHKRNCANRKLLRNFGITLDEFSEMSARQNHLCLICGRAQMYQGKTRLYVDHDHKTGKIRGLLCGHCNFALGHVDDSPSILRKMARYIEDPIGWKREEAEELSG